MIVKQLHRGLHAGLHRRLYTGIHRGLNINTKYEHWNNSPF